MNLRKNHEMLLHFVMAFIGGYFGLYAIVARNDLFGSAQTSNLIYLVQDIVGGRPVDFVIRIGALVLYSTAVALSVWLPKHTAVNNKILSILIDGGAAILLGFLPKDMNPVLGLYPIFFAMAFQWCSFKGIGGYNSATVFSTNNLRQFVSAVTLFADEKKQEHLAKIKILWRNTSLLPCRSWSSLCRMAVLRCNKHLALFSRLAGSVRTCRIRA